VQTTVPHSQYCLKAKAICSRFPFCLYKQGKSSKLKFSVKHFCFTQYPQLQQQVLPGHIFRIAGKKITLPCISRNPNAWLSCTLHPPSAEVPVPVGRQQAPSPPGPAPELVPRGRAGPGSAPTAGDLQLPLQVGPLSSHPVFRTEYHAISPSV